LIEGHLCRIAAPRPRWFQGRDGRIDFKMLPSCNRAMAVSCRFPNLPRQGISMSIQIGDKIPASTLNILKDGVQAVNTDEVFKGRKVVLFSVPGAFTPTCSAKHLPGYVEKLGE